VRSQPVRSENVVHLEETVEHTNGFKKGSGLFACSQYPHQKAWTVLDRAGGFQQHFKQPGELFDGAE
jgi:hypothetical protein